MDNKQRPRTFNSLLIPVLLLMMFIFVFSPMVRGSFSSGQDSYTLEAFEKDLKDGNVTSVTITPNRDNDTGYAVVVLSDNSRNVLYATQIAVIEQTARNAGVEPVVKDIPSDNAFMISVLPTILVVVVCLFFFYMMNAQNMGGGSNAKMMNFGRSKARLSKNSGVTLDDVAGLQEEKEDLEEIIDFRFGFRRDVRRCRRIPRERYV